MQEETDKVIAYASETFTKTQRDLSATKHESFAVCTLKCFSGITCRAGKMSLSHIKKRWCGCTALKNPEAMIALKLEISVQFDSGVRTKRG